VLPSPAAPPSLSRGVDGLATPPVNAQSIDSEASVDGDGGNVPLALIITLSLVSAVGILAVLFCFLRRTRAKFSPPAWRTPRPSPAVSANMPYALTRQTSRSTRESIEQPQLTTPAWPPHDSSESPRSSGRRNCKPRVHEMHVQMHALHDHSASNLPVEQLQQHSAEEDSLGLA